MSINEGLEPSASDLVADLEGVDKGGGVVLLREVLERGSGEVVSVELAVELQGFEDATDRVFLEDGEPYIMYAPLLPDPIPHPKTHPPPWPPAYRHRTEKMLRV